jgi:ribosomal protein S12 methylthiotransferase accessory factor
MASGRDPLRDPAWRRAAGVTRVARLTGLDRTGVEVASAVRPLGHVLQVTNGKGARFADAALGALMEAAELDAAERAVPDAWDSAEALRDRHGGAVLSPGALAPGDAAPAWERIRMAWRAGVDLLSGAPALVPAHAVHVPPPGGPPLGPALVRWTSNGMGAAPRRADAVLHALLEAVERDQLARALPAGFTEREIARRLVAPRSLARAAPRTAALAASLEARGFGVHLLDLAPRLGAAAGPTDLGLPCAAALLVDHEHGPVPVAAGYACRLRRDEALRAALLEAAQSRATEIHGAREDVSAGDRRGAVAIAAACARTRAARDAARMPDVRAAGGAAGVRAALARLRRAGLPRAVAVDLAGPPGVAVVKVLVPGLLLSELL